MKPLCLHTLADAFARDFSSNKRSSKIIEALQEKRDDLKDSGNKVVVFQFMLLLLIIATLQSGKASLEFAGIHWGDAHAFIFSLFVLGNFVFLVNCGLFYRVALYELIIRAMLDKCEPPDKPYKSLLMSSHMSTYAILNQNVDFKQANIARFAHQFAASYGNIFLLIALYTLIYMVVLFIYIVQTMHQAHYTYGIILCILNLLSTIIIATFLMPCGHADLKAQVVENKE